MAQQTVDFFHVHAGCLDADDRCHAFCFRSEIVWEDGSRQPFVVCPNEASHPGDMLDMRERLIKPK